MFLSNEKKTISDSNLKEIKREIKQIMQIE